MGAKIFRYVTECKIDKTVAIASRSLGSVSSGRRKTKAVTRLGVRGRWKEGFTLGEGGQMSNGTENNAKAETLAG